MKRTPIRQLPQLPFKEKVRWVPVPGQVMLLSDRAYMITAVAPWRDTVDPRFHTPQDSDLRICAECTEPGLKGWNGSVSYGLNVVSDGMLGCRAWPDIRIISLESWRSMPDKNRFLSWPYIPKVKVKKCA